MPARGSLILGDLDEARRRISDAASAGYDTPDVRYTRGEIEGRLYREALAKAEHIADRDLRETAIRAAQKDHRDRALRDSATPRARASRVRCTSKRRSPFRRALERRHRRRPPRRGRRPWMYEARILEAAVPLARNR
jgi:hypothetical protein